MHVGRPIVYHGVQAWTTPIGVPVECGTVNRMSPYTAVTASLFHLPDRPTITGHDDGDDDRDSLVQKTYHNLY